MLCPLVPGGMKSGIPPYFRTSSSPPSPPPLLQAGVIHSPLYTEVGKDHHGNTYYQRKASETQTNRDRVIIFAPQFMQGYGQYDATAITSEWHAWIHHTTNEIPGNAPKPFYHIDKPTYDPASPYLPKGHVRHGTQRRIWAKVQSWSPPS